MDHVHDTNPDAYSALRCAFVKAFMASPYEPVPTPDDRIKSKPVHEIVSWLSTSDEEMRAVYIPMLRVMALACESHDAAIHAIALPWLSELAKRYAKEHESAAVESDLFGVQS